MVRAIGLRGMGGCMDARDALFESLKAAERHLAQAREHIARERELLAQLEEDGHQAAATRVKLLLESSLETQARHERDRERILLALGRVLINRDP
jgi:hypothetical protein